MNFAHILAFFFLVGAATSSPIQSRDVEPQPYWIIEAISEGDFSKALEILEDHVTHLGDWQKYRGNFVGGDSSFDREDPRHADGRKNQSNCGKMDPKDFEKSRRHQKENSGCARQT